MRLEAVEIAAWHQERIRKVNLSGRFIDIRDCDERHEALSHALASGWPSGAGISAEASVFSANGMGYETLMRVPALLNVLRGGCKIAIYRGSRDHRAAVGIPIGSRPKVASHQQGWQQWEERKGFESTPEGRTRLDARGHLLRRRRSGNDMFAAVGSFDGLRATGRSQVQSGL